MGNFNNFSLGIFRNWNKLELKGYSSTVNGNSQKTEPVSFTAYCKEPIRINTAIKIGDSASAATGLLNTFMNMMGTTSALDIPRKYSFRGTDPVSFSQRCYLVLEDDPKKDLEGELKKLLKLFLPKSVNSFKESAPSGLSDVAGFMDTALSSIGTGLTNVTSFVTSLISTDLSQWITKSSDEIGKSIRYLKIPDALSPVDFDESKSLKFRKGAVYFEGLFIKSVGITIPELMYAKGYPPYIALDITFETFRPASDRSFQDLFSGAIRY
nr:MAG TPA: hypothetical protein [Bacteriophage sp.]